VPCSLGVFPWQTNAADRNSRKRRGATAAAGTPVTRQPEKPSRTGCRPPVHSLTNQAECARQAAHCCPVPPCCVCMENQPLAPWCSQRQAAWRSVRRCVCRGRYIKCSAYAACRVKVYVVVKLLTQERTMSQRCRSARVKRNANAWFAAPRDVTSNPRGRGKGRRNPRACRKRIAPDNIRRFIRRLSPFIRPAFSAALLPRNG